MRLAEPISQETRAPRYVLVTSFAFRDGTRQHATRNTEHETDAAVAATIGGSLDRETVPGGLMRGNMDGAYNRRTLTLRPLICFAMRPPVGR